MPPRTCEVTGKFCQPKKKAESVAKQMNHRQHDWPVHAYHCSGCGFWHIGHVPTTDLGRRRRRT